MSTRRGSQKLGKVAYMEEADDSGNVIEGTDVTYAASSAPSPTKEKMNTCKKKSRRSESESPVNNTLTDSDSTVHPRRDSRMKPRDRDMEREKSGSGGSSKKTVTLAARPPNRHAKTMPPAPSATQYQQRRSRDESQYYGVDPSTVTSAASRPRAHTAANPRPASYYGSRPPVSNTRYHMMQPPPALPPTSYPPAAWQAAGPVGFPVAPPPGPPQPDYFSQRPPPPNQQLLQRFSLNRPASAMAHHTPAAIGYGEEYDLPDERGPLVRRPSQNRKSRIEDDRQRMPPPPRPATTRPSRSSPFAPPPAPARRGSTYEDEAFEGESTLYQDVSPPLAPYDYAPPMHHRPHRPRRPSMGAPPSVVYEMEPYSTTEVATTAGGGNRRNSYYGQSVSSGSGFEDKLRQASTYQDEVSGGTVPLTAETLRKASKNGGPGSRSTRSSGSHDESDWRQSATTRTTRSSNEEDVTIKVKGGAVLKYGGAEVQCQDGAEVNISSRSGGPPERGLRSVSDKSSYVDLDERRTRVDRLPIRNRATSQAASYSRTTPPVVGYGYGGYDYTSPFAPAPTGGDWL